MNYDFLPSVTYVIKNRYCTESNNLFKTEFYSKNSLESRNDAIRFIENYLEIITNEGLIHIESDFILASAIKNINTDICIPNKNNYDRLKIFNQETILIIPNETIFPFGITLSFKLTENFGDLKKDKEYELFSLKKTNETDYSEQLNNLINEYQLLKQLGYNADNKISLTKKSFSNLTIKQKTFEILDTPFLWNNETRQFFVNNVTNEDSLLDSLYERLFQHEKYNYVHFLETNCPKKIEKNIYTMLHGKGGLLFLGYHPENLTESILSDEEILDYYDFLNKICDKDKYLHKNINLQIFSFDDFPILAISVFPLNDESRKNNAYNPNKVFVLQNNRFIKMKNN